jgi:hypothetical protein
MGYASLPDQIANQSKVRGRSVRGDFTYKFEEALRGSQCKLDSNGDRRISYREALAVTGQSTKQVIPWWAECFLVDQSPQSSGDCENHFQVGDEVQAAQTFEITDSQGRACTIQHNETLIISQSSSTTRGQVKLEAPQRCGFQSGVTRALNLRNLPANNVRVPAPAGGLQQGPGTK